MELLGASQHSKWEARHPSLKAKIRRMVHLGRQISAKAFAGPGWEGSKAHQRMVSSWQREHEQLEAELSRVIPEIASWQRLRSVEAAEVAEVLPTDSVLVEVARFQRASSASAAHYVAFVLPPKSSDRLRLIDLGAAEALDGLVLKYRSALGTQTQKSAKAITESGERLREAF